MRKHTPSRLAPTTSSFTFGDCPPSQLLRAGARQFLARRSRWYTDVFCFCVWAARCRWPARASYRPLLQTMRLHPRKLPWPPHTLPLPCSELRVSPSAAYEYRYGKRRTSPRASNREPGRCPLRERAAVRPSILESKCLSAFIPMD